MGGNGNDHGLDRCHSRRKGETVVVAMGHDDGADGTSREAPGRLIRGGELIFLILILNAKGLGKTVSKVVGCGRLQGLAVMHHCLNGIGGLGTGKLVTLGLLSADDREGEFLLIEVGVDIQHALCLLLGLLGRGVERMALLPEEFSGAEERAGGLLPPYDGNPLVIELREVSPGVDCIGPVVTEQRLRGGADTEPLIEFLLAAHGDPGDFRGKTFDMVLLFLEQALGDEHGHADIDMAGLLELVVKDALDVLPDGISVRPDDHAALYAGVADKLRLKADVGVPLGEVLIHGRNVVDHFLLFCHSMDFLPDVLIP